MSDTFDNFPKQWVNILMDKGGLGDQICRLPAIIYALRKWPHVRFNLHVHGYFIELGDHLMPEDLKIKVRWFALRPKMREEHSLYPTIDIMSGGHSNLRTHLAVHAWRRIVDTDEVMEELNYPEFRDVEDISYMMPEKYAVICLGFKAPTRRWLPKAIYAVIDYLNSKGVKPILMGKHLMTGKDRTPVRYTELEIDQSKVIDLRDTTPLLRAGQIIKGARCIVGVDNGLLHLAGCTDVPIVAGYTTLDPKHRMPIRRGEIGWNTFVVQPEIDCRFCQSRMNYVYLHHFSQCIYDHYKCVYDISDETAWVSATEGALNGTDISNATPELHSEPN